jgi:hypothetical protein
MGQRNPDLATLTSEALEAADEFITHMETCFANECDTAKYLRKIYRTKKDKALKAIRGKRG